MLEACTERGEWDPGGRGYISINYIFQMHKNFEEERRGDENNSEVLVSAVAKKHSHIQSVYTAHWQV